MSEQQQEYACAERQRGGEGAERAGQHLGHGVHTTAPGSAGRPPRRCPGPQPVCRPWRRGRERASGRGPRSMRRVLPVRSGTSLDISPSILRQTSHPVVLRETLNPAPFRHPATLRPLGRCLGVRFTPQRKAGSKGKESPGQGLAKQQGGQGRKAQAGQLMGLTSNKVLVLAVLSAVLLFVGTVWWWPRLARHNWRAVIGRIGLLLVTQVAIFASSACSPTRRSGSTRAGLAPLRSGERPGRGRLPRRPGRSDGGPLQAVYCSGECVGRDPAADRRPDPEGRHRRPYDTHRHARVRLPSPRVLPVALPHPQFPGGHNPHRLPGYRRGAHQGSALSADGSRLVQERADAADDPRHDEADGRAAAGHGVRGHPRAVRRPRRSSPRTSPTPCRLTTGGQKARKLGHRR